MWNDENTTTHVFRSQSFCKIMETLGDLDASPKVTIYDLSANCFEQLYVTCEVSLYYKQRLLLKMLGKGHACTRNDNDAAVQYIYHSTVHV